MKEQLDEVLRHWGLENRNVTEAKESGAAIASGVWYLGDDLSLKKGSNIEGFRHHAHISRVLRKNGITASCPLPTLAGEDCLLVEDGYFAITERVRDNFLSTRKTEADDALALQMYAVEARRFSAALCAREPGFAAAMVWAREKTEEIVASLPKNCAEGQLYLCATPITLAPEELVARTEPSDGDKAIDGLQAMIILFIAWSSGMFADLAAGNWALAQALDGVRHKALPE